MASMLERIEANRKGAETGKPASASAQTNEGGRYTRAAQSNTMLGRIQQQRQENLYTRALQDSQSPAQIGALTTTGGSGLYAQAAQTIGQRIQERRESGLYSQALQGTDPSASLRMTGRDSSAALPSAQDDSGAGTNAARGTSALLGGVLDKADNRESGLYSSAYADILRRQDYAQNSQAGESKIHGFSFNNDERYDYINNIGNERERADLAQRRGTGARDFGKYAFMTQDEVGVYNYLYATEGKKAANAFLDELEPELDKQWYSGVERNTTDWTGQNALTKTIGSAATVIAQPARTMTSALAVGEDALRMLQGKEINPYSGLRQVSRLSQDVRNDVAEDMNDVGRFAYQTAMSAADSAVNSLMAGGLAGGLGLSGDALMKTTNVIGSGLMSSEVAAMGIAESKEKGYSDIGALSLGLVRGGFEYLSEAIGGEWAIRNIKANPNSFLRSMMLNAIPEGVEEVMSDAANEGLNLVIDRLFGTEESYIGQAYKYFKENGTAAQKKNPELWTMLTILQQEGLSFLGGAAATIGTSGVQFANYHRSIVDASRRLNTTPETVQQIMGELGTDNPAAVDLLAQLHGVNNAEDLRSRIGEAKTAAEAIDTAMRQQGQNENAPEGRGAVNVEGALNNGEQSYGGEQFGNAGIGTGGEAFNDEGRTAALRMDAGNEGSAAGNRFQNLVREEVTPAALGITRGSGSQTVQVLDESRFAEGSPEAQAAARARANGLEPTFILGTMQIGEGENIKQARAYIIGNHVILQADGRYNADQLLNHELYHQAARQNPELNRTIRRVLASNMSEAELNDLVAQYISAYDGVYDFSTMSAEDITAICEEELFADLYAGIDNYNREQLRADARQGFTEAQTMQQQNAEAERDTRGPPEKGKITPNSTEEERYEILKEKTIMPATVNLKALEGTEYGNLKAYDQMKENRTLRGKDLTSLQNAMRKIATKLQINEVDLQNSALSFPFRFSNTNVGKSTNHQKEFSGSFEDLAKTLSCLSDLVDGAELIETHTEKKTGTKRENHDLKQTYVLLGAMREGSNIIPVEMVVKEFHTSGAGLYMTVTMSNISGSEVLEKASAGNAAATQSLFTEPTISIQKLLAAVKPEDGRLLKYAPDQFLNEEQKNAKQKAIERQEREYDAIRVDGRGSINVPATGDFGQQGMFSVEVPIEQRVSGDQLLDAEDLIETVQAVGADVDENGYITLYHRTSPAVAEKIKRTGRMTAREDGLFFSTKENGQNAGYGTAVVELKIPAENLVLDDIFDDEAHLRLPLEGGRWSKDVSEWIVKQDSSPLAQNNRGGQASVEVSANNENARSANENAQNENKNAQNDNGNAQNNNGNAQDSSPVAQNDSISQMDADQLRRELRQQEQAYQDAMAVNDPDFDYRGTSRRIQEIEGRLREMDTTSAPDGAPSHQGEGVQVEASQGEATEMEQAERDLKEVGESRIRTEDGEYKMLVRMKKDGGYLASVDRNGKRDVSRTFASAEEAAAFAAQYVQGQINAREDAELDRERSAPIRRQGALEALFTGKVQDEAERLKKNKAAEAATQTLRERIRRTEAEIQALSRLEKTTGLTEQQKAHKADLEQTRDIMNDELTARKGRVAKKKKAKTEATGNKPTRSAAEAKNALMDLFHTASGERAEVGRRIEQKLVEIADNGHLTEQSRDELIDMMMDAGMVPKQADTAYQEARNWLRGTRIYVDEHERADFGDNWDSLRKRAWANGIYLTGDIRDGRIDTINRQLADTFGENMFPTDSALSDMLGNMIDQAERGRTTQQSLADAIEGEARATGESARTIYEDMFRQMDETLRTFAEKAGLEVELKNRTATELAAERKRWEDRMERRAQQRRETEIRNKVLKGLQRLTKLRGKAAPEVRAQVDEVLRDIDTYARRLTLSGIEDLQALQRTYEEAAKTAGFVDDENPGNFIRNPYVKERLARLSQKHIDDMDIGEVIELGRVVAALETTIRNQNEMIGEEWDRTIQETSEAVRSEVNNTRGARPGFLQKWFMEEHLSPRRFLEMLGGWKNGTMRKLSQSLEDGQTRQLDFQRRAMQSFDDFVNKKENKKWLETASGKKAVWQKYGVVNGMAMDGSGFTGQSIEITPMMRVALYMHSLNEDNLRHIQTGGLVIPNKTLYQQGKIQEAYAQGEKVKMQPQAVRAIAAQLTEQEKNFANHLQKFFDTMSKEAINEVSLQLDGFERAGVDHYFPIESSSSYLKSDVAGEARAQTVEGIGSIANERVHASNPIMLSDASEVLLRQIDKVSRYYGYAIPIRNFQAVNNYVFHDEGNAFAGSIKDTINKKWGAGAENYITKMLADLQSGGRRSDMMGSALAKLRGNLAGATLMFNPSVAVSQAASYPGAAQALGWDALAAGLAPRRVDTKLMEKYTPLYWYRNQGNSTQELGDALKEKGLEQKLPWALNWIQKMDSLTIRRLWAAAEYRVSKDNPNLRPGSKAQIDAGEDAYFKKVAEVFNRAVYDTQPNYTNMERAQILRSDSDVTKFLTMYKTVPLQYYGMMVEAAGRLNAAMHGGTEAEKTEARKYFANTMGGLLAANSVYVVMKALFKGFRKKDDDYRDEEGNLTAASAGKQLGKELLEVYAGSVIGGAEAYSAAQALITGSKWRGPEMSALSHVEDIVNGIGSIFTALDSQDPRKAAGAVKNAAANIAMAMGVPAKNAETYIMAAIRWAAPEVAMEYDNMFGGIDKSNLRGMDEETLGTATNIILRNRTGARLDPSVTDELARLYSAGYREAVPTAIPESFSYGETTVEISDRKAYSETWGSIVGDNLEELLTADAYVAGNDETKKAMIDRLYDYATVQARKGADPDYDPSSSSTYAWTVKADECVGAGVSLPDTISAMAAIGGMTADKDANGNSISGSKKEKVVAYINGLDLTDEQKDALYLTVGGYKESTLDTTPWNDGSGKYTSSGRRSGRRGGGGRRSSGTKAKAVSGAGKIGQISRSNRSGSDNALAALFGGAGSTVTTANRRSADASTELLDIVNRYYGGNPLAAAMDGGRKARTSVDFKL